MLFNQYETVAWIIYTIFLYIQMLWMFLYSEMARKTCDTFLKKTTKPERYLDDGLVLPQNESGVE